MKQSELATQEGPIMQPGDSLTKKVTIDRSRWLVPSTCPDEDGVLLDRTGFRCCLGFLGQACGVPDAPMLGKPLPGDVNGYDLWPAPLFTKTPLSKTGSEDDTWATVFAAFNDADIDNATREEFIAHGFRVVLGLDTEFVGEYPAPRPENRCPCGELLQQGQPMSECENCNGTGEVGPDDEWDY